MTIATHHTPTASPLMVIIRGHLPLFFGVAVCMDVAFFAQAIGPETGVPVMLLALCTGMVLGHLIPWLFATDAGVAYSAKTLLRLGIVCLGARISVADIVDIGVMPFITVIVALPCTILFGIMLSRMMKRDLSFGVLTGGAVAICGASAALALSTVLPRAKNGEDRLPGVIAVVTILSSITMIGYPVLLRWLGLPDAEIGIVLGASIHDVGQAVASGYSVSPEAGATATVVKLSRVMLLPVVIVVLAVLLRGQGQAQGGATVPSFILGFLALAAANSLGLIPEAVTSVLTTASTGLLVTAIAGIGMRTRMDAVLGLGWRLPAILTLETVFLGAVAIAFWI